VVVARPKEKGGFDNDPPGFNPMPSDSSKFMKGPTHDPKNKNKINKMNYK
jgi:hypothetical protein